MSAFTALAWIVMRRSSSMNLSANSSPAATCSSIENCTPVSDRSVTCTSYSLPSTAYWQKIAVITAGMCTSTRAACRPGPSSLISTRASTPIACSNEWYSASASSNRAVQGWSPTAKRRVSCSTPPICSRGRYARSTSPSSSKGSHGNCFPSCDVAGTPVRPGSDANARAAAPSTLLLGHERIPVVGRRHERLLDRAGARPPDQVPHGAGLVVGAGCAGAAEWLLPDHRAGRLVVHVEVAGGVAQRVVRLRDGRPVGGEHGAGESVGRGGVDHIERVIEPLLVVHVGGHDRPEQLPLHQVERGVFGCDHGRADEVAVAVVGVPTDHDLGIVRLLDHVERVRLGGVCALDDHGAHEVAEVLDRAHADGRHLR